MRKFINLVLTGLVTVLPLTLTIWLIYWLFAGIEAILKPFLPEHWYFPGSGVIAGLLLIVIVGLMVNAFAIRKLILVGNRLLERIPLVKSVYGALTDVTALLKYNREANMDRAVMVEVADDMHLIGFVTSEAAGKQLLGNSNKVAVYMPMSYQIGGYTLYIDKQKLTPLSMPVEEAMRMAITGSASLKPDNEAEPQQAQKS